MHPPPCDAAAPPERNHPSACQSGSGRRRDAATGHALAHIAHHWLVIRSHAAPSAARSAISIIRRNCRLVNEMGIQIWLRDTPAVLSGIRKTNRTISPTTKIGAPKSFAPLRFALIQGKYGGRLRSSWKALRGRVNASGTFSTTECCLRFRRDC